MKSFLIKNKVAYLVLLVILACFTFFFLRAWPDKELQRYITGFFGLSYFLWGLITHINSKRMSSEIVFEYLAVALLAVLMITLITL